MKSGVITWLTKNITIPILKVVAFDASEENHIAYDYTLLSKACGVT